MVSIVALWMPIVVSAILVFLVSSVVHMALKYHQADYKQIPDEQRRIAELRGLEPGYYVFPYCMDMKEMGSAEMTAKYNNGPCGYLAVIPSAPPSMGKPLAQWFFYCVLVGLFAAYIVGRTLGAGADYLAVFRLVGTVTFMTYGLSAVVGSIWQAMPWSNTLRHMFDGLLYALVTAGTFGWLWPQS